jgi:hypothetical protein
VPVNSTARQAIALSISISAHYTIADRQLLGRPPWRGNHPLDRQGALSGGLLSIGPVHEKLILR